MNIPIFFFFLSILFVFQPRYQFFRFFQFDLIIYLKKTHILFVFVSFIFYRCMTTCRKYMPLLWFLISFFVLISTPNAWVDIISSLIYGCFLCFFFLTETDTTWLYVLIGVIGKN